MEREVSPIILLYPGQGPDPRVLPSVSKPLQEAYHDVTGLTIEGVSEIPDDIAYTGVVAQPLHIVRTAAAYERLNQLLERKGLEPISEKAGLIREPASLSEYLAFSHVGSWDMHTSIEAAHQRGKYSDKFAESNPGKYGMLATFYTAVMTSDISRDKPLLARIKEITGTEGAELSDYEVTKGVYVGSFASEGLITLTGLKSELSKIHEQLRKHRREIGSISLNRINGAYHSPLMHHVKEEMTEFITNAPTADPDPRRGVLYSPTTGEQVRKSDDIKQIARDLLVLPVNQTLVFNGIWKTIRQSDLSTLPAIEIGNSRDYPWGEQQGVQTACIRDYYLYHDLLNSNGKKIILDTVTFDGTDQNAESSTFNRFAKKYMKLQ